MLELEHPEIGWIERTGYPSWLQDRDEDGAEDDFEYPDLDDADDYCDRDYEEARERDLFGD